MDLSTPVRIDTAPFLTADRAAIASVLPEPLQPLAEEIVHSRRILEWPDDFDDEGSPGYDEAVWLRAVEFVVANAVRLWEDRQMVLPVPSIAPGPYGSIDLHWRPPRRELLLNIPVEAQEPVEFFGHDGAFGHQIKGSLALADDISWLMQWLMAR